MFYSGAASALPGCVQCCEVREVCLLANHDIGRRVRVSKHGVEVVANSVSVLGTRGVARPDWHMKFYKIILQKSRWPYGVSQSASA